mgnify:CR=1 FL=1
MSEAYDLLITGGTCVLPAGRTRADLGVSGGRIAAVGDLASAKAIASIDAAGL